MELLVAIAIGVLTFSGVYLILRARTFSAWHWALPYSPTQ